MKACSCVYLAALTRRSEHAPGSALPRLAAPRTARHAPCFYSSPLDAARSKDGAGPRRLMLGTLAACLRFRRQLGRCRRSALLNVGPRLAARRRLPPSRRLTPPGSFRPSSRLRFRGRARRGSRCGLTGFTHQPPQCRFAAQPAKKERKPCGLNARTACLVRRFAPAERRSFSRLDRCRVFPMSGKSARDFSNHWKIRSRFAR